MSEDTKANLGQADFLSESSDSTGISDSSESDQPLRKAKKKKQHMAIKVAKPAHARAQGPEEVIKRYRKVLKTSKVRTMSEAFSRHNVDRGTIVFTAAIAELAIVDPNTYESLASTSTKETLAAFAKKCAPNITEETKNKIQDMKAKGQLLPIRWK
ncbi:hypothetical protein SRHO_G00186320 [Serrasalmus rhombeus]